MDIKSGGDFSLEQKRNPTGMHEVASMTSSMIEELIGGDVVSGGQEE